MSYNQVIKNQLLLLKLKGVLACFEKQTKSQNHLELSFDERLTDLLQAEIECKNQRKVERLRKKSKIKYKTASLTDIDLEPSRNININLYNSLYNCNWIIEERNLIITGPTGSGKTWIACAYGNQAIMNGYAVYFTRTNYLASEISVARANGTYMAFLDKFSKNKLIILDDLFVSKMTHKDEYELLELIESTINKCSLIVTSQYPIKDWYAQFNNPTIADAILDRIIHNSYRIELKAKVSKRRKEDLMKKFE